MIEIEHLSKRYGEHPAVSDLSVTIESGQIYGFLGPNGAGKSTTMNIMAGCLSATEGHVRIGGYDIFDEPEKAKRLIGYLCRRDALRRGVCGAGSCPNRPRCADHYPLQLLTGHLAAHGHAV